MTPSLWFDVDGTLINSRPLVERAYLEIGVTPPEHAWGLRWQDWLVEHCGGSYELALDLHMRKMDAYADLLLRTDIKQLELPAAQIARRWIKNNGWRSVRYLTASAAHTACGITMRLGLGAHLSGNLTYAERLAAILTAPPGTIYLDDNGATLVKLESDAPHVRTIHVRDQSLEKLEYQIGELS